MKKMEVNRQMKFGKETSNYEKKQPDHAAPELVLFLQESKYHFVTDISTDADSDHQLNPENKQRLLFKSAKWNHKSTEGQGSSSSTNLSLDLDCTHKQIDHPDEPVLLHSHHHTTKGVRVKREAVSGSSSSMGRFSTTEGGYISEASASASSMYRSDSLATMGRCSRKGSSVDEIRFSDFSASFWAMRGFSGDVSLSSTSSNASAHSFAFPVLPAEWNGSPVRMAVADPRKLRKQQRTWKTSLLCCRF